MPYVKPALFEGRFKALLRCRIFVRHQDNFGITRAAGSTDIVRISAFRIIAEKTKAVKDLRNFL